MTYNDAKLQLLLHSVGTTDAAGEPLVLNDGFIGSLRPYRCLLEQNVHLVMEALLSVGERIACESQVDRDLANAVWSLCSTARDYALRSDGMLQRNKLIAAVDIDRLMRWVEMIERTALSLLRGWPPHHAVYYYAAYVVEVDAWDNAGFFVKLMDRAVGDPELGDMIETMTDALGKIGGRASAALPALRHAELQSYTWLEPEEHCTAEVRARIRRAIQAIESPTR